MAGRSITSDMTCDIIVLLHEKIVYQLNIHSVTDVYVYRKYIPAGGGKF